MSRSVPLAIAVAAAVGCFAWLQARTPRLVDQDSYYHARYAQILPERGLSREFPWMRESIWRDQFSDKDLLFHALLAPFCRGEDVVGGAKAAAWAFDAAIVLALALVLARHGFRAPWLWVLLVPALGNHWLFRMLEVRGHLLSVLLFLLGVHFLLARKPIGLYVVGFVYSWSYAAPHLLVGFAAVDAVARSVDERRFVWKSLAASAGGVVAGLIVHPYFPNDVRLWWVQNVIVLSSAWGVQGDAALRLGDEFASVTTRDLLATATLPALCLAGAFLAAIFRRRDLSARTRVLATYVVAAFALYCLSAKFVEYFAPVALLVAASVASDLWPEKTARQVLLVLALLVAGGALATKSLSDTRRGVQANCPAPELEGASKWIRENVPAGETIVHLDWGDFVQLFYFDPTHRYLVGLDPAFAYVRDASRMRLLEDVRSGRRPLDPKQLAETFSARWLVLKHRYVPLASDALLSPAYEDDGAAVFRLAD